MAKIRAEDIAEVRDRARIDDVVGQTVALKPAGGGSLKGLCPFHDERSPSFQVSPAKGLWYCFGCGEGGDTIDFVMRTEALGFGEAVEKLADRFGVRLQYEEGGTAPGRQQGQRTRLVAANAAAAEFFVESLRGEEAQTGRTFLTERGFDDEAVARFGVGYAPKSWDALTGRLRSLGFRDDELRTAGLVSDGRRGVYDRFRGRLVWPIRDLSGDVVGFGARKLFDDDNGPKYLNTPETPLYKKSNVLYGIDLARQAIAKQQQAVIVEGYTDVMACHLAGVHTAVATCGTSFGEGHVKVLRRLLMDSDAMSGQVVFTFDGDAAGQRAALRAFDTDQSFVAQTYVAVQPDGLDPCDLRLRDGDTAVRELVAHRVPMFEFAMRARVAEHDLDTAEGRVAALHSAAPLIASIRDVALRGEYTASLAGWLGVQPAAVQSEVRRAGGTRRDQHRDGPTATSRHGDSRDGTQRPPPDERTDVRSASRPDADRRLEQQAIQVIVQRPDLVADWLDATEESAFTDPMLVAVFRAVRAAGTPPTEEADLRGWLEEVMRLAGDDQVRSEVRKWSVLGMPLAPDADIAGYARGVMAGLHQWDVGRRITPLKGRLARLDPAGDPEEFGALMAQVMDLEAYRRSLRDQSVGEA